MLNIEKMNVNSDLFCVDDEQLFTELTLEEGATISGGEGKSSTSINLKLPDSYTLPNKNSINFNPLPPKKSKNSKLEIDKDCQCIFPNGGSVGVHGDFVGNTPIVGGAIRF
jgi:hypothetical protein